jgi:hypothetical protein
MASLAFVIFLSMLLCSTAFGQPAITVGANGSSSSKSTIGDKAPAKLPSTSPPKIDAATSESSADDRPTLGLSRTHIIIIGSCVAVAVAAAVIVGIVVRRRRLAQLARADPQIVIGGSVQMYSPPAASAPPLNDDNSASVEIAKPYAADTNIQMPL